MKNSVKLAFFSALLLSSLTLSSCSDSLKPQASTPSGPQTPGVPGEKPAGDNGSTNGSGSGSVGGPDVPQPHSGSTGVGPAPVGPSRAATPGKTTRAPLETGQKLITLLGTNDLHGSVEPSLDATHPEAHKTGGLALFSGIVNAIKQGLKVHYGENAGVLLLDGGDQYQGTLISNYSEGELMYTLMDMMNYDGVVPGNHAYDFGPAGWKVDHSPDPLKRREAVENLRAKFSTFPLLSANTYLISSLQSQDGRSVEIKDSAGCLPKDPHHKIDWSKAKRPVAQVNQTIKGQELFQPYLIKNVAGVNIAMIGLDTLMTPITTTPDNVKDLCFRDEIDTYNELRDQLDGKADLFVILAHHGGKDGDKFSGSMEGIVKKISLGGVNRLHAVIAGHTHKDETIFVDGAVGAVKIPIIQSGTNGVHFGRIDLIWDSHAKSVVTPRTEAHGGLTMHLDQCSVGSESFCEIKTTASGKQLTFEGVSVILDQKIADKIAEARKQVAPIAEEKLGKAITAIKRDRIEESSLANLLTDMLLQAARSRFTTVDASFMNTGGIRSDVAPGSFTYEELFQMLPFNNHTMLVYPMSWPDLKAALLLSAQTCGQSGALMQSGLHVTFERDCRDKNGTVDPKARLLKVEVVDSAGKVNETVLDVANKVEKTERKFVVVTLDFLAAGGDGYGVFGKPEYTHQDLETDPEKVILRDILVGEFRKLKGGAEAEIPGQIDHRWVAKLPATSHL